MLPAIAGTDIAIPITWRWASSLALRRENAPSRVHGANEAPRSPGSTQACGRETKALVERARQAGAASGTSPSHHGTAAGRSAARHRRHLAA